MITPLNQVKKINVYEFKQRFSQYLKETLPMLITNNGKPSVVLLTVQQYDEIVVRIAELELEVKKLKLSE